MTQDIKSLIFYDIYLHQRSLNRIYNFQSFEHKQWVRYMVKDINNNVLQHFYRSRDVWIPILSVIYVEKLLKN
jgi:hypothetical protein